MPNRTRIILNLAWPPALLMAAAGLADAQLARLGSLLPFGAAMQEGLAWVPSALVAVALVWLAVSAVRIARWELEKGPDCHRCGGLLGREQKGLYGLYRRCLSCAKAVNERHYLWPG